MVFDVKLASRERLQPSLEIARRCDNQKRLPWRRNRKRSCAAAVPIVTA
jgi:hypothetical protein